MTEQLETASDGVARRVKELRQRRGWSAARLAQQCADQGAPQLTASVIANIESGRRDKQGRRRRDVTVDEAFAFGRALDEPVAALLGLAVIEGHPELLDQLRDQVGRLERMVSGAQRSRIIGPAGGR
jgi:transcriptional regulator with XRE-family HTH domain